MYECHVTISPQYDEYRLNKLKELCKLHGFKVAELLMQRRQEDTPERSKNDTFTTGHSKFYVDIYNDMVNLIKDLKTNGYDVWRYKIEDIKLDSKYQGDVLKLL